MQCSERSEPSLSERLPASVAGAVYLVSLEEDRMVMRDPAGRRARRVRKKFEFDNSALLAF